MIVLTSDDLQTRVDFDFFQHEVSNYLFHHVTNFSYSRIIFRLTGNNGATQDVVSNIYASANTLRSKLSALSLKIQKAIESGGFIDEGVESGNGVVDNLLADGGIKSIIAKVIIQAA